MASARVEFWRLTAEEFGLPLSGEQERELSEILHDEVAVLDRWFPHLADVERNEVLWALGEFTRSHTSTAAAAHEYAACTAR